MWTKKLGALAGTATLVITSQAIAASSAAADGGTDDNCPRDGWSCEWSTYSDTQTYPWDDGGTGATATIEMRDSLGRPQGGYQAKFRAYDETVEVSDNYADGARAHVWVRYMIDGKSYAEHFSVGGGKRSFQIGPDNNLPEGTRVSINLGINGNDSLPNPPQAVAHA